MKFNNKGAGAEPPPADARATFLVTVRHASVANARAARRGASMAAATLETAAAQPPPRIG